MIISDMKKNELTETEMNSVAGGVSAGNCDFIYNREEEKLFASLSIAEKCEVFAQPDIASQRAKMFEILRKNQ